MTQRVLIPTNDMVLTVPGLAHGYTSLGYDVSVGTANLELRLGCYDIVHLQWPEELVGWGVPSDIQIARISDCLEWWRERCQIVITIHNLMPHTYSTNTQFEKLYTAVFECCDVITHFSEFSRTAVLNFYPKSSRATHVVHGMDSCELTVAGQTRRGDRRSEFGIGDDKFVILTIGTIRLHDEISLIKRSFDAANIPNKQLLTASKIAIMGGNRLQTRLQLANWKWWLTRRRAVVESAFVPEEEISKFMDSSNVVILPRLEGLNSAVIFLGMALGCMIIAPDIGAFPEQLKGTRNLLYRAGDHRSLADVLEQASHSDTCSIGKENAEIAAMTGWKDIVLHWTWA